MPNPLCAKSRIQTQVGHCVTSCQNCRGERDTDDSTLAPRRVYPGEPPTAGELYLRAECRCRSLAPHVSACYPGTIDAHAGSLLVFGLF